MTLRDLYLRLKWKSRQDNRIDENNPDHVVDNTETAGEKEMSPVGARSKKMILTCVAAVIAAAVGFGVITYLVKNAGTRMNGLVQRSYSAVAQGPARSLVAPVQASLVVPAPASSLFLPPKITQPSNKVPEAKSAQQSVMVVKQSEVTADRDVFKDFFSKVPDQSAEKNPKRAERKTDYPKVPVPTGDPSEKGRVYNLQPAQMMGAVTAVNQQDIDISGTVCVNDGCTAITPNGSYNKGDKIGNEIITSIGKNWLETDKRKVLFH